jgi:hypothetical protein
MSGGPFLFITCQVVTDMKKYFYKFKLLNWKGCKEERSVKDDLCYNSTFVCISLIFPLASTMIELHTFHPL